MPSFKESLEDLLSFKMATAHWSQCDRGSRLPLAKMAMASLYLLLTIFPGFFILVLGIQMRCMYVHPVEDQERGKDCTVPGCVHPMGQLEEHEEATEGSVGLALLDL